MLEKPDASADDFFRNKIYKPFQCKLLHVYYSLLLFPQQYSDVSILCHCLLFLPPEIQVCSFNSFCVMATYNVC